MPDFAGMRAVRPLSGRRGEGHVEEGLYGTSQSYEYAASDAATYGKYCRKT